MRGSCFVKLKHQPKSCVTAVLKAIPQAHQIGLFPSVLTRSFSQKPPTYTTRKSCVPRFSAPHLRSRYVNGFVQSRIDEIYVRVYTTATEKLYTKLIYKRFISGVSGRPLSCQEFQPNIFSWKAWKLNLDVSIWRNAGLAFWPDGNVN